MRSRIGVEEGAEEQVRGIGDRTVKRGKPSRRSRRTVTAATLLVYGSTFLWMTSPFAGTKKPPGGATWTIANVGALVSLVLFTLAAWCVLKSRPWWERAAALGATAGLAALVPYGIAASSTGVAGPGLNSAIHIAGNAAILLVLLVPAFEGRMKSWLPGDGRSPKQQDVPPAPTRPASSRPGAHPQPR